jgi:hypothetical protein
VAYVARYGHQPLPVIWSLSLRELNAFQEALSWLVKEENPKPGS